MRNAVMSGLSRGSVVITQVPAGNVSLPTVQYTHGMLSCCEFTGVALSTLLDMCGADIQGERYVLAEGAERFVRAVRGGRQAVCAEPNPREQRDQRELVKGVGVFDVFRSAENNPLQSDRHG